MAKPSSMKSTNTRSRKSKRPALSPTDTESAVPSEVRPTENEPARGAPATTVPQIVQNAIDAGLALIRDGKSKADAARAIYEQIKEEEKDVVVAAFVSGATLTPKGAMTYWYNCRRRVAKQKS